MLNSIPSNQGSKLYDKLYVLKYLILKFIFVL